MPVVPCDLRKQRIDLVCRTFDMLNEQATLAVKSSGNPTGTIVPPALQVNPRVQLAGLIGLAGIKESSEHVFRSVPST